MKTSSLTLTFWPYNLDFNRDHQLSGDNSAKFGNYEPKGSKDPA